MSYHGITSTSGDIFYNTGDAGLVTAGTLFGDVSGGIKQTLVSGIHNNFIQAGTPNTGEILRWDGTKWAFFASGTAPSSGPHNLLSSTHTDTQASTVGRGDLVYGSGVSPTWAKLPLGTSGNVVWSDGADVKYTPLGQVTPFHNGVSGAPTVTFNGDLNTGWSNPSADVMVGSVGGVGQVVLDDSASIKSTIFNAGQQWFHRTFTGTWTAMTPRDHLLICNLSAPATVALTTSPQNGKIYIIKDGSGNANTNRITIHGSGALIDGNSSININNKYGSYTLFYNGAQWNIL